MPIAGGILVAGSASRCLSSAAGMLRFLARLSGRRRHVRRSCGPGGGTGCCGTVKAGETRAISGSACITSECGSIGNMAGTSATTTTTTTTATTMSAGTATTRNATTTSSRTTTTTTTTTTTMRIDDKSRIETRTNDQTIDRIQDSRWTPLEISIERLSCDRLQRSNDHEDDSPCRCPAESCSHHHHHYSSINTDESLRSNQDHEYLERSYELSRRLELKSSLDSAFTSETLHPPDDDEVGPHLELVQAQTHRLEPENNTAEQQQHDNISRVDRRLEYNGQRLTGKRQDELDKYSRVEDIKDNHERVSRRFHHRLHSHRNNKHSTPETLSSSPIVDTSFDDTATTTITTTTTTTTTATTTTTTISRTRTRTKDCGGRGEPLVDDSNSRNNDNPSKFLRSSISSNDPTIYQNEIQQRELSRNQRNGHRTDNSSFSNTSYTRRRTFPPYLATLLIISYTLFGIADACSSRSTPKPRPPTPTPRPNITFHMYTCPPDYAEWYCLNGATCFTVKIQESLLYNCLCANGFIGQRCEFKDLDGSYLPSRQRVMLETASIAGGATIAVFLVVIICIAAYIHCKRKQKELRTSSTCVDTVDGPGRDPELRPFSNRSRSLMIFMAKNPNGSTRPSIEQTRMPGWCDYSQTETARMASVNEEKRGSSQ